MNLRLLNKILATDDGFLATVIKTEGHTYKKQESRALFVPDQAVPVHGNLGSLCVDQELFAASKRALAAGKPQLVDIDTSKSTDIDFGYGTYCGGRMWILVEPVFAQHKKIYEQLRRHLENRKVCYLEHETLTGDIVLSTEPQEQRQYVIREEVHPPQRILLFGATPLARHVIHHLEGMDFDIHVADWRPAHLNALADITHIHRHTGDPVFEKDFAVLVQSHDFRRDKAVIARATELGCGYIGMLSSRTRRDQMFKELREEGVAQADIKRISSPVGLNIGGNTDAEIAISIVAELVVILNQ